MLVLLPLVFLLLSPIVILSLHLARIRPAYFWLVSSLGVIPAWLLVLFTRVRLPQSFSLLPWEPAELFSITPSLIIDEFSWPFASAVTSLALASLLVCLVYQVGAGRHSMQWKHWASLMICSGFSLLAVMAGDLIALLLAWTALDFIEIILWLSSIKNMQNRERLIITFSMRLAGTFVAIWAVEAALADGHSLSFFSLKTQTAALLLVAVSLRLGVVPPNPSISTIQLQNHSLGILWHLAPIAANLIVIVRASTFVLPLSSPMFLAGLALVSLVGSIAWVLSADEILGRNYWVITISGLALAMGERALPYASLGWGLALLLSGALLMLASAHFKTLIPILFLGALSITSMPFSPTWSGLHLYSSPFHWTNILFLVAQSFLLMGYLRHAMRKRQAFASPERWIRIIYPTGLLFLVGMIFLLGASGNLPGHPLHTPGFFESWPGFVVFTVGGIWFFTFRRSASISLSRLERSRPFLSIAWVYRFFWGFYQALRRISFAISAILEGQAGVLWAFLIFLLLVSVFSQVSFGG